MNDRFTARLRQHLVDTANERPAEGVLAAIDARIAKTDQQIPFVARLTLEPGRTWVVPTATARLVLLAVALGLILGAFALVAGSQRGGQGFAGSWVTVDPADGSTMVLVISAGDDPTVRFQDQFSSGAACVDEISKVFTADGTGTIDGDVLHVVYPDGGGCGSTVVDVPSASYTYDGGSDTILDDAGLRWQRTAVADILATEPPLRSRAAARTPEPSPVCIDMADGGRYTAPMGSMAVSATVPDGALLAWQADAEVFYLRSACTFDVVQIGIYPSTATEVIQSTCFPFDNSAIDSFADGVDRLSTPTGSDIVGPIELTIDGHPAVRFDVTRLSTCTNFGLWDGTGLGLSESGSIYFIDVDGELVAIEVNHTPGRLTPAAIDEAHAIVVSMEFELPGGGATTPESEPSVVPETPSPPPSEVPASVEPVASGAPSAEPDETIPSASPDETLVEPSASVAP
jgi:hypothetical protein